MPVTVLGVLAVMPLVLAIVAGGPNGRLRRFGRSLGHYLRQIAGFMSFGTEAAPFPFADGPTAS